MSLPVYQHINVRTIQLEDLKNFLIKDLNLKHPVVLNLKFLEIDQQREMIGLIENFFETNNISFKFPYPVYLVTDHESTITQMPTARDTESLPKFFTQRETKMNVKESQVISRNRLLQQEITNADSQNVDESLRKYGQVHKQIYEMETERMFYRSILTRLMKGKKNG
jgi:hypothetical protein